MRRSSAGTISSSVSPGWITPPTVLTCILTTSPAVGARMRNRSTFSAALSNFSRMSKMRSSISLRSLKTSALNSMVSCRIFSSSSPILAFALASDAARLPALPKSPARSRSRAATRTRVVNPLSNSFFNISSSVREMRLCSRFAAASAS